MAGYWRPHRQKHPPRSQLQADATLEKSESITPLPNPADSPRTRCQIYARKNRAQISKSWCARDRQRVGGQKVQEKKATTITLNLVRKPGELKSSLSRRTAALALSRASPRQQERSRSPQRYPPGRRSCNGKPTRPGRLTHSVQVVFADKRGPRRGKEGPPPPHHGFGDVGRWLGAALAGSRSPDGTDLQHPDIGWRPGRLLRCSDPERDYEKR
jgi:hypothetical protein